ncbi:MAG: peroxide stress protein YaaA, partial [Betaproteobacteria bacterium]|nr:peroxide stress protein YaaA [Betaproteobacteria bacterium]
MLFLLSPAKSLDYETPLRELPQTPPLFVPQSAELIGQLREQSPQQIAELMSLSDSLAGLNVARYQAWRRKPTAQNARQAVLAFNGDVYEGLDARSLGDEDLAWLQDHLCILSGLYGVLRPLDLMQPYRLEMGTRLANARGKDLYQFWQAEVAAYLNRRLKA